MRVKRDGHEWAQKYSRGKAVSKLKKGEKTKAHGTRITFRPDTEIFRTIKFSGERLELMIQEKAFLNRGLTLHFTNEIVGKKRHFVLRMG